MSTNRQKLNDKMNIELNPSVISGNDVLSVSHLSKAFDDNTLFTDISFDIKRGERVALIGNNGTGKTTILKIINDILPADSGEIKLGSKVNDRLLRPGAPRIRPGQNLV